VGAHVASRARVIEEDKKRLAPETFVPPLVVDEITKGATCLSKCGRGTGVAEKCREDDDLFDEFMREQEKRSREERHVPVANVLD
jgi:hypothetical protein